MRLLPDRQAGVYQVVIAAEPTITTAVELNEIVDTAPPRPSQREREPGGEVLTLTINGHRQRATIASAGDICWVQTRAGMVRLRAVPLLPEPRPPADAGGSLRAPMPGVVLAVLVTPGQRVAPGDALLKLEAMKMEHTIRTAAAGVVEAIYFAPGDTVEVDAILAKIQPLDNHEERIEDRG